MLSNVAPLAEGFPYQQASANAVEAASAAITRCYRLARHQIGSALVSASGSVYTGIHLEAMVGRASICAEAVALGNAILAQDQNLLVLASVRNPKPTETSEARLVPPCGLCRELLLDYFPKLSVVLDVADRMELLPLEKFLPHKYRGTKWEHEESG